MRYEAKVLVPVVEARWWKLSQADFEKWVLSLYGGFTLGPQCFGMTEQWGAEQVIPYYIGFAGQPQLEADAIRARVKDCFAQETVYIRVMHSEVELLG